MSIFKRRDDQQTGEALATQTGVQAAQPGQATKLTPPFVSPVATPRSAAPGVVPPPAAPIYSTRPPEPPRVQTESSVAERARVRVQGGVRVAMERARNATSSTSTASGFQRRPDRAVHHPPRLRDIHDFDPARAAQTGLLNLAWSWQEAGAPIRAIHAYMQLLHRYPDTPAAAAAVADLVELSDKLADEGQFHTALAIYDQLEELLA